MFKGCLTSHIFCGREAIKKKTPSERGGEVSGKTKLFINVMFGHVFVFLTWGGRVGQKIDKS